MPAFMDGRCTRCGARIGWFGEATDMPPCPKCGHQVPREELERDQKFLDEMEQLLFERGKKNAAREAEAAATPQAAKVAHVKRATQDRPHHCHWPGCKQQVPPAKWGCYKHWMRLPYYLRRKVWAAYNPGQEVNFTPSREYLKVAREVQEWIRDNYPEDWEFANA